MNNLRVKSVVVLKRFSALAPRAYFKSIKELLYKFKNKFSVDELQFTLWALISDSLCFAFLYSNGYS